MYMDQCKRAMQCFEKLAVGMVKLPPNMRSWPRRLVSCRLGGTLPLGVSTFMTHVPHARRLEWHLT